MLQPPKWILEKLGDKPRSNIGLDFRGKDNSSSKKKSVKHSKSKGRKLGS